MKRRSPTLEGFRAIFRVPSLGLAEIAWRWSFAVAGGALLIFAAFQSLDTLPVTSGDLALLRTRQPALISRAALHIFHGSAPRAIAVAIVTVLFIAIAWIVVASLGRAAGIKVLLDYFRAGRNSSQASSTSLPSAQGWRLGSVMGLNFLRVAITLAAFIGCVGALLLAGSVSSEKNPSPGIAALVFFMAVLLITMAWSILNWFLARSHVPRRRRARHVRSDCFCHRFVSLPQRANARRQHVVWPCTHRSALPLQFIGYGSHRPCWSFARESSSICGACSGAAVFRGCRLFTRGPLGGICAHCARPRCLSACRCPRVIRRPSVRRPQRYTSRPGRADSQRSAADPNTI